MLFVNEQRVFGSPFNLVCVIWMVVDSKHLCVSSMNIMEA